MSWTPAHTVGDTDVDIPAAKRKLSGNSYGKAIGQDRSTTYTEEFGKALVQYGLNVNADIDAGKRAGPRVTAGGVFDWTVKDQMDIGKYASPPPPAFRNIWIFSAPGSGAPWWVGPSFSTGKWCAEVLHLNHQPVGYPIGGYMGLLGGDPGLSYNEVIAALSAELERLLDTNENVQTALRRVKDGLSTDIEFWFTAYSQSADGMEDALERLFGNGGKYEKLRSRINGSIQFGNPSRQLGDGPAPGWGISRKIREPWLRAITRSITATSPGAPDFYACCDDEIRPLFYYEIVQSETTLSFFEHLVKVVIPILIGFLTSVAGGFGSITGAIIGMIMSATGLSSGTAGEAVNIGQDPTEDSVTTKLRELFTIKGLVTNIPALFRLLGSVSGVQTHGLYEDPHPEFGGRTGVQVACDMVASYHR